MRFALIAAIVCSAAPTANGVAPRKLLLFKFVIFLAPMKSTWVAKWNYSECNIAGLSKNQLHVKAWLSMINRIGGRAVRISHTSRSLQA
jgi:hypothetical protein